MAGGPKTETDRDFFGMVRGAMDAGAKGVAIGRNVFQHDDPKRMTEAICRIVHDGGSVEDGLDVLSGK
jgi:fructose-bisphosphate aldolase/2-amino-3,7-dideoxy-D-threo-hept-6-ulosonate synthase